MASPEPLSLWCSWLVDRAEDRHGSVSMSIGKLHSRFMLDAFPLVPFALTLAVDPQRIGVDYLSTLWFYKERGCDARSNEQTNNINKEDYGTQ
jgi:hypothetical protein